MKKSLLLLISILVFGQFVFGQQIGFYSQYFLNDFVLNPAIAGSKEHSPITLGIHKQWVGINQSPATQTLSAHTMLENNTVGLGGAIYHDSYGATSQLGMQAVYSYHFHIDRKNKISLGIAAIAMQYTMDQRFFELTNYNDPAITYGIEKTIIPDATFGVYAYGRKYWGGISVAHLFQSKLKINTNLKENTMVRHYFASGGYRFVFSNTNPLEIEPSVLLKLTERTPLQIDINIKMIYKKDYWFGISIRPEDSFIAAFGLKYLNYYFGYAYDFTFTDIGNYTSGSQEIVLGVNIGENKRKSKRFY